VKKLRADHEDLETELRNTRLDFANRTQEPKKSRRRNPFMTFEATFAKEMKKLGSDKSKSPTLSVEARHRSRNKSKNKKVTKK